MNDARLLIVGREDGVARGWTDHLREAGANISVVGDGASALRHLSMLESELILLDLRLEGPHDGFDTCRAIRARSATIIAVASASDGPYDEVVALAVGADHFIPADTPAEVVVARLRTLLRRARGAVLVDAAVGASGPGGPGGPTGTGVPALERDRSRTGARTGARNGVHVRSAARSAQLTLMGGAGPDTLAERIVDGDLEIDLVAREVTVCGAPVALTRIEFDLLVALARHPRRVFTRDQLMASAWEEAFDGSHVLDAHLSRLRGKITAAGGERVAHAVRGVGYRLRA